MTGMVRQSLTSLADSVAGRAMTTLGTGRAMTTLGAGGGLSGDTMAVMGDSIALGPPTVSAGEEWAYLVSQELGATLTNQAVSGTVLQNSDDASMSARANNGRDNYVSWVTGGNLKEILVIGYINDARYTGAPDTFNVYQYHNDYREIVAGCISAGYDPDKIVVCAPSWISDTGLATGSGGFSGQPRSQFEIFVTAAYETAREYGTRYYDAYNHMQANGGDSLLGDGIHPTAAGHVVMKNGILAARKYAAYTNNANPVFSTTAFNVNENAAFSQQLLVDKPCTFSITGGADQALFSVNANGLLTMTAKDYESPADANTDNVYEVTVTATDIHSNATAQALTVTVLDLAEAASLADVLALSPYIAISMADTGFLWQDSIGGTQADTNGQVLNVIEDQSGNDYHFTVNDGTYDPLLSISGGVNWAKIDAINEQLKSAALTSPPSNCSVIFAYKNLSDPDTPDTSGIMFDNGNAAGTSRYLGFFSDGSTSTAFGSNAGTPTCWVDGVQMTDRGEFENAIADGLPHVVEFRNVNLSSGWGNFAFPGYVVNGLMAFGYFAELFVIPSLSSGDRDNTVVPYIEATVGIA